MGFQNKVLSVRGLKTYFFTTDGVVKAVDDISFDVNKGEKLGFVGESGSGKTCTALSIMRLIRSPGRIVAGQIAFANFGNLLEKSEKEMRNIRGSKIAMIFQDPMTYLNPVIRVGDQISEAIVIHQNVDKSEAMRRAIDAMKLVQIPSAEKRAKEYPHQMSGGMQQRVLTAMAIACRPLVLLADEPTTALDVIVQMEILELLNRLKSELGTALVLITHDLAIIAKATDRTMVMYAGRLFEVADTKTIFAHPRHPYTKALLESIPRPDFRAKKLKTIKGTIPDVRNVPSGCAFHPRCSYAKQVCTTVIPPMEEVKPGHAVACFRSEEI